MGFIGWAWWDSCSRSVYLGKDQWSVTSWASGIHASKAVLSPVGGRAAATAVDAPFPAMKFSAPFLVRGLERADPGEEEWLAEMDRPEPDYRAYTQKGLKYMPVEDLILYVPYWLIMAVVGVVWMGLLRWRWMKAGGGMRDAG